MCVFCAETKVLMFSHVISGIMFSDMAAGLVLGCSAVIQKVFFLIFWNEEHVFFSVLIKSNLFLWPVNIRFLFLAKTFAPLVVKLHGLREAPVILALLQWSLRGSLG